MALVMSLYLRIGLVIKASNGRGWGGAEEMAQWSGVLLALPEALPEFVHQHTH